MDPQPLISVEQETSLISWPVRRLFRVMWGVLCFSALLVALPWVCWDFKEKGLAPKHYAWFIGGVFVILSFPISLYEVAMHTEYYTQPRLQRHVIRILWMVPIYGIDSWFALRFESSRKFLDPVREIYEAYVIYNFLALLMAYLEGAVDNLSTHRAEEPPVKHAWGFNCILRPWPQGSKFLWECKKGVLNYVILRPVCTLLTAVAAYYDILGHGKGRLRPDRAYMYLVFTTSTSQTYAMYCLVMLYQNYHDELAPIRPFSKFLCVKAVIFLSFWQGIAVQWLVYKDIIHADKEHFPNRDFASGIQNFLICIEMFFAALAHTYAFPPRDYMDHSIPTKGFFSNVHHMFDLTDVTSGVQSVLGEHYDAATDGLQHVAGIPQRAIGSVAGLVTVPHTYLQSLLYGSSGDVESASGVAQLDRDEHDGIVICNTDTAAPSPLLAGRAAEPVADGSDLMSNRNSGSLPSPAVAGRATP